MGRELSGRRPVPVAALETGAGSDCLQLGSLVGRDERSDQIPDPPSERARETARQNRLIAQPDGGGKFGCDWDPFEPHRHLDPAEFVRGPWGFGWLDLESSSPQLLKAGICLGRVWR